VGLTFASSLAIIIFVLDTLSPLDFAVAVLYVVVIVVAATYFDKRGVLITALACALLTILSFLIEHGTRLHGTAPLRLAVSLASIAIATALVLLNLSTNAELRASERKRTNLSRFFSPKLIDQLVEVDGPLSITRYQPAVIMFIDMVGFTAFSARHSSEAVVGMLRELLDLLSKSVFAHDGTIDKFLGDGLLAVFGVPLPGSADAKNAVACALEISRSLERWNEERRKIGETDIQIAIGIHAGDVIFGDVGSDARLELTVLGETVALASRVEAYCRSLDTEILATAAFVNLLRAEGDGELAGSFRDEGWHVLRGRVEPTHLYSAGRRHSSRSKPALATLAVPANRDDPFCNPFEAGCKSEDHA
jgi:class 3 adenylate cyclase